MTCFKKKAFFFYFIEICSLLLFMTFSMALEFLTPYQRTPDINDKSISFPHTKFEIVSALMLPLFNMGIPTFVLLSIACIDRFKDKKMFMALLGLYFTISLAFLLTNIFKSPVGRLRPDFLDRCIPDHNLLPKLVVCTGHASSTFAGLGFISLLLSEHLCLFDGSRRIYKFIVFLIPIITAALISISRIMDYRHHWDDVLIGSIIGCISALAGYFYFYPLLFKPAIQKPADDENVQNIENRTSV